MTGELIRPRPAWLIRLVEVLDHVQDVQLTFHAAADRTAQGFGDARDLLTFQRVVERQRHCRG